MRTSIKIRLRVRLKVRIRIRIRVSMRSTTKMGGMYRNRDGVHTKTNEVKDKHGHRDQGNIERETKQKNCE